VWAIQEGREVAAYINEYLSRPTAETAPLAATVAV
jgi:hypothetical protein